MYRQTSVLLFLVFALGMIAISCRYGANAAAGQSVAPQKVHGAVMYALATPADLPGLSRKTDRETEHLFGPVKTVTREEFDTATFLGFFPYKRSHATSFVAFNTDGNKTAETFSDAGDRSLQRTSTSYDEQGRKVARVMYWNNAGTSTYAYKYDGNEIEAVEQRKDKDVFSASSRYVAVYDADGKQIEARYSEGDSAANEQKAFYRYSYAAGHLMEIATHAASGAVYYRLVYAYDEKGRVTSEITYGPDGQLHQKSLFSYDGNRKRIEKTIVGSDASRMRMVELYDGRDNLVEVSGLEPAEGGRFITERSYEYDQYGNWIRQTIQSVDAAAGKVMARWFEERRIEYY